MCLVLRLLTRELVPESRYDRQMFKTPLKYQKKRPICLIIKNMYKYTLHNA